MISGEYQLIIQNELIDLESRFSGVSVDYFILMSDHMHLILFLENSNVTIPKIVQAFKSLTTLKIKKRGYSGKRFWQPNYYEHVIRNEKALNKIRQYIIDNPMVEQLNWNEFEKQ